MIAPFRLLILFLSLAVLTTGPAIGASPLTILHSFDSAPDGAYPAAPLVEGVDGNFYGTTSGGTSSYGSVFKMTSDGVRTTLVTFDGANNGANPNGLCLGKDGNFYGTTKNGGFFRMGTVFKMTPDGDLTTLYSFSGPDGAWPVAGLVQGVDGNFYGTTYNGGYITGRTFTNIGTIFKITPDGVLTTLHVFDGSLEEGYNPSSTLLLARDGNFYGVTPNGGQCTLGTLFRMTPAGDFQTLLTFGGLFPLCNPTSAPVQGADGFFYGATSAGGRGFAGGIYKMSLSGAGTVIYEFSNSVDGSHPVSIAPNGLILGRDGNFYGTTQQNSYPTNWQGSVFKMDQNANVSFLANFTGGNGGKPLAALVQGRDGNFYGTTYLGGDSNVGTIFKITSVGSLTTLNSFLTLPTGALPKAPLLLANDGNFYGTTERGGNSDAGTAFRISPSGDFTTLATFTAATGAYPSAKLIQGLDGNFYGTTSGGGDSSLNGSVFEMSPVGYLGIMATFPGAPGDSMGNAPPLPDAHTSELIQGADGNFYGANWPGGTGETGGTIFKVGPSMAFKSLVSFDPIHGSIPYAGLTLGTDGNFYGANNSSWFGLLGQNPNTLGTVFSMTQSGALTNLVNLSATSGYSPYAALLRGPDGNFYGTMANGGANNMGTVFEVTPLGALTTIATFDGAISGKHPRSGLILGQDGRFYGTTVGDPANGDYGTIFSVSNAGDLTTLYRFSGPDGSSPLGLVQYTDGSFYGVTSSGGPGGAGEVFSFYPTPVITFPPISTQLVTNQLTVTAKTSAGAPVQFTVVSGPATVSNSGSGPNTVSSGVVSFTGTGLVTIQASQIVSADYALAPPVTQSFRVVSANAPQTITFPPLTDIPYVAPPITLSATASSGLTVTYSVVSGPATVSGNQVTMTGPGTIQIAADQAGNASYGRAPRVTQTFIATSAQTITFPPIADQVYPVTPFDVNATASSGLPITYTISGPATMLRNRVTVTGPGTVKISADQAGNATYSRAPHVSRFFNVARAQTITFPPMANTTYPSAPFYVSATAFSGLNVTYSVVSGPATILRNRVTVTGTGTVKIAADQAGSSLYAPAPEVTQSFTASPVP